MTRRIARKGDVISWDTLQGHRRGTVYEVSCGYLMVKLDEPRQKYSHEELLGMEPDLYKDEVHQHNGRYTIEVFVLKEPK